MSFFDRDISTDLRPQVADVVRDVGQNRPVDGFERRLRAPCASGAEAVIPLRKRSAIRGAGTRMYPREVTEHGCE
jgi:hypothetical protein